MDFKVPLNRLKFGQEDGAGINARVVGRQDGIAELAVNLHARGQIENLVVKACGEGFYSVANGNRRLAAFHMLYTPESETPINCTLRDVDEAGAFEDSLTTAVTAKQLHPVDQYEAFARLRDFGKTDEEIARQYGMTERQVRQALALGRLSPKIRQAWRDGVIRTETARAFTLTVDAKTQDKVFAKLQKGHMLSEHWVRSELGADKTAEDVAQLLGFVGAQAYRDRGGKVTEDLFGNSHIISDAPLLKTMAREMMAETCAQLKADGWSWVEIEADLPQGARWWREAEIGALSYEGDEEARLGKARAALEALQDDEDYSPANEAQQDALQAEINDITTAARLRSFDGKKRRKLGCIVDVENGRISLRVGLKQPEEVKVYGGGDAGDDEGNARGAKASVKKPDEPEISQALLHRLSLQLTEATATALIQNEQLALSVLLAGSECMSDCGVKVSVSGIGSRGERGLLGSEDMAKALPLAMRLKPAERITLLAQLAANALDFQNRSLDEEDRDSGPISICNAIDPKAFNAALRGAFDAKDYFHGVSKALCLKAIEESLGPDFVRQHAKKPKGEISAFAIENVPKTGWLPPQLRAKGYDGPPAAKKQAAPTGVAKGKKPAAKAKKSTAKKTVKKAKR